MQRSKTVLTIIDDVCISCGLCRESCPFDDVVLTKGPPLGRSTVDDRKPMYEIVHDGCRYCGGVDKAPCSVYCPVEGAIVDLLFTGEDDVNGCWYPKREWRTEPAAVAETVDEPTAPARHRT